MTGGCQCGAVRFRTSGEPRRISVCHCRMCQRATGGLHAPLAEFDAEAVTWDGEPAVWASSNISERGFCARCGTPLFLRDLAGGTVEFMIGAMADPDALRPSYNYGTESRIAWLSDLNGLPDYETGGGPDDDGVTIESRQKDI